MYDTSCDHADVAGLSADSTGYDEFREAAAVSRVEFTEPAKADTGRRRA